MLSLVFVGSLLDFTNCPTSRLTRFSQPWKSSQKADPEYWDPKSPRILRPQKGPQNIETQKRPQNIDTKKAPEYKKTFIGLYILGPRKMRSKIWPRILIPKKAPKYWNPEKAKEHWDPKGPQNIKTQNKVVKILHPKIKGTLGLWKKNLLTLQLDTFVDILPKIWEKAFHSL